MLSAIFLPPQCCGPKTSSFRIRAGARGFILLLHLFIFDRGRSFMQVLENWKPKGVTVYMDDKRFLNCVLTECKLVYGGGDVTWENTQFVNCQLTFDGAAQRTVAYL